MTSVIEADGMGRCLGDTRVPDCVGVVPAVPGSDGPARAPGPMSGSRRRRRDRGRPGARPTMPAPAGPSSAATRSVADAHRVRELSSQTGLSFSAGGDVTGTGAWARLSTLLTSSPGKREPGPSSCRPGSRSRTPRAAARGASGHEPASSSNPSSWSADQPGTSRQPGPDPAMRADWCASPGGPLQLRRRSSRPPRNRTVWGGDRHDHLGRAPARHTPDGLERHPGGRRIRVHPTDAARGSSNRHPDQGGRKDRPATAEGDRTGGRDRRVRSCRDRRPARRPSPPSSAHCTFPALTGVVLPHQPHPRRADRSTTTSAVPLYGRPGPSATATAAGGSPRQVRTLAVRGLMGAVRTPSSCAPGVTLPAPGPPRSAWATSHMQQQDSCLRAR